MIDKLDLRVPKDSLRNQTLMRAFSWNPARQKKSVVQPALHYDGRADLHSLGIDANLHFRCKHGDHHSKLEILDVGKKPLSEILSIIEQVTDAKPETLAIMRIDLAADVPNVTVPWFKEHLRFKYKRTNREFGKNTYGLIGHGEIETILAGNRPNVFRVYNKVAENLMQFRRMLRLASPDADLPAFEDEFGMKESDVLTRLESQFGARGIPARIRTMGSLGELREFDPFSRLELTNSCSRELPPPEQCDGMEYYTGLGLNAEAKRLGMQGLRKQLNKQTNRNAARTIASYERFFPRGNSPITMDAILHIFHESLRRQLAD